MHTVQKFVERLDITPEYVNELKKYVMELWNKRQGELVNDNVNVDIKINEFRMAAKATAEKMRYLTSEVAIKYMEQDLIKFESEIGELEQAKSQKASNPINMELVMERVGYFLEHLEDLLLRSPNPLQRGAYFGLVFAKAPTYQELISGTPQLAPCIGLKGDTGHLSIPIGDPNLPASEPDYY
jgi:hypothetical protein